MPLAVQDIEGGVARLEGGLGLKVTKIGSGDKDKAYIIGRDRMLKLFASCVALITVFAYAATANKLVSNCPCDARVPGQMQGYS